MIWSSYGFREGFDIFNSQEYDEFLWQIYSVKVSCVRTKILECIAILSFSLFLFRSFSSEAHGGLFLLCRQRFNR